MLSLPSVDDLKGFEEEIAALYKDKQIHGPIHLRDGSENHLRYYFHLNVVAEDWVFCTWASHLQALLKLVPREQVKQKILEGKSITLHFPEHNFYSSAIVGGICPIAVGVAAGLKRRGERGTVHAFIGDMTALTGIAYESIMYSFVHRLPVRWVVENNGKSVDTPTEAAWGGAYNLFAKHAPPNVWCYDFKSKWPHAGVGEFISF